MMSLVESSREYFDCNIKDCVVRYTGIPENHIAVAGSKEISNDAKYLFLGGMLGTILPLVIVIYLSISIPKSIAIIATMIIVYLISDWGGKVGVGVSIIAFLMLVFIFDILNLISVIVLLILILFGLFIMINCRAGSFNMVAEEFGAFASIRISQLLIMCNLRNLRASEPESL